MSNSRATLMSAPSPPYPVDDWTRLDRLLILGSESATCYAAGPPLAIEQAPAVRRALALDGPRVIRTVLNITASGHATRSDPALFVLAAAAGCDSAATRSLALAALPKVARTGADLFCFAAFVDTMRGWGRGLRRAIADWYLEKPIDELAYDVAQYPGRDGWRHSDLLRLSHPKAKGARDALFRWVVSGDFDHKRPPEVESGDLRLIYAVEEARLASSASDVAKLIASYGLTPEMVPPRFLDSVAVWSALLERLPLESMLKHLGRMTRIGLLRPSSEATRLVVSRLGNDWAIGRAGLHPLQVLAAMLTYNSGGRRGWTPSTAISAALDRAFYLSLANVPRTGKRFYLGLDVSGSMDNREIAGVPGLTPRIAAAAMSLVTARVERDTCIGAFAPGMAPLAITAADTLRTVVDMTRRRPSGEIDCALPILDAAARGIETDIFVVLTGSKIEAGETHPVEALCRYREQTGIAAKLLVVGMLADHFSIADPGDAGTLDVVGFDTATPNLIADFAAA